MHFLGYISSKTARVHGSIDAQVFHTLYDADNLVPATTTCATAKRTLALTKSSYVARYQKSEVRALSLNLKKPCAILCPNISGSIAPQPSHELHFRQLVDIARAMEITMMFDWKWCQPEEIGPFLTVVSLPETFTGFCIGGKNVTGRPGEGEEVGTVNVWTLRLYTQNTYLQLVVMSFSGRQHILHTMQMLTYRNAILQLGIIDIASCRHVSITCGADPPHTFMQKQKSPPRYCT